MLSLAQAPSSTAAASSSQAAAPTAAGAEEDNWAAFMDAANPPVPADAQSPQQPAIEDHWDAFQVRMLAAVKKSRASAGPI